MGTSAAFSTNGQIYLANAADLYITNSPTGTNQRPGSQRHQHFHLLSGCSQGHSFIRPLSRLIITY